MFKETAVNKLIEYIQALPQKQQEKIADTITAKKATRKVASSKRPGKRILDFIAYTQKLPVRLPKNYKFDREEANER